ncbi:right-handed parallel beta-helix repeat-containing protein [Cupriavidus pinatubonensis]|uniref:right-handed parallel beta-helix repeat-containing protein n=1 Tax=Cupriavidus pinatubonensis TaxID=248026 RepID=UPI001CC5EC2F|nr:right-handed parallel beta-helix repeat-containing protein [Cupriavidus pinatubonensis]
MDINIRPDLSVLQSSGLRCPAKPVPRCSARLEEAITLIQNPEWQRGLSGQYSKVHLHLAEGTYRLMVPLSLRWGAGETNNVPLQVTGSGVKTVVSGAAVVTHWSPATKGEAISRIPLVARRQVQVADVSESGLDLSVSQPPRGFGLPIVPTTTEVFYRNAPQPLAAWPNQGYGRILRPEGLPATDKISFAIAGRAVREWQSEPDLQVFGYWFWDWAAQNYRIAGRDVAVNVMTLADPGSLFGIREGQRARVENALTELDMAGEWYLDRKRGELYFWPPDTLKDGEVEISIAEALLNIEHSRNVTVQDMLIEKTRGDAITIKQSSDVVLERLTIRDTGNRALVVTEGARWGLRNSLVEDTGEGGILLSGGGRRTLEPAGHFAVSNVIRRFSRLVKTYRPAVEIAGVGQSIEGNTISDAPHSAIIFRGNDHRISGNEIFSVVLETSDAGAVYTGRDFTARGTVIEDNFLHDIRSNDSRREVKGVYLDDQACGIAVRHNIFSRVQQPVFIGGGRDNLIDQNIFYESSPAIHLDARGLSWQRKATMDPKGELQSKLDALPYRSEPFVSRYPNLSKIREDDIGAPKYNVVRGNVIVKGIPFSIDENAKSGIELGKFIEKQEGDFATHEPPNGRIKREDFRLRD